MEEISIEGEDPQSIIAGIFGITDIVAIAILSIQDEANPTICYVLSLKQCLIGDLNDYHVLDSCGCLVVADTDQPKEPHQGD